MKKKQKTVGQDRYTAILLKDLKHDFRVVAEALEALQQGQVQLIARVGRLEEELKLKLSGTENSLHGHMLVTKQDLRAYLVQSKQDLRSGLAKVIGLEISKNLQPLKAGLDRCEQEIDALREAS